MRRRGFTMATAIAGTLMLSTGVAAAAGWQAYSSGASTAKAGALVAPNLNAVTNVTATGATINWATPGGFQNAATYTATGTAASHPTKTCNATASTGSCSLSSLDPSTTYSVSVGAKVGANWTSSAATTTVATPPAAPNSVSVVSGGGYINGSTASSVNIDVALPSSSLAGDTVHLTVDDGSNTVTPSTKSGTAGAGTVHFTGLNLTGLSEGSVTLTAWVTNGNGSSTNETSTATKDTVAPPAPSVTTRDAGSNKVEVTFSDSEAGVSFLCNSDGGAYSACASPKTFNGKNGTHTFGVEAVDAAGNISTATVKSQSA